MTNGAQLQASTNGQGDAGSVNINARDTVSFSGVDSNGVSKGASSTVESGAVGNSGDINITTGSLSVTNGAQLQTLTRGQGDAGSVTIEASDTISFDGLDSNGFPSGPITSVEATAEGNGGDINIKTRSLYLINGAQLNADTFGRGNAGNIQVSATDAIELTGTLSRLASGLLITGGLFTDTTGTGAAGDLTITTGQLTIRDGGAVSSDTSGEGQGGTLTVRAADAIGLIGTTLDGRLASGLSTDTSGAGAAGDLIITTGQLTVQNGAAVASDTHGEGQGGTLTVRASGAIELIGTTPDGQAASGLFADTSGAGAAGDLTITTEQLTIRDRAEVTVRSTSSGKAGNLQLTARNLLLDNQGAITATTKLGNGGNITLRTQDLLLLRRDSQISTSAGTALAGGDGGNITIDTDLIVAVPSEDSNITANAFTGSGGRVNITTQSIFGISFRDRLTELSDITASSEFGVSGTVEINTPDVDPSQGLVTLPAQLVDAAGLIAQTCPASGGQRQSEFIVTGRGGLPPNPSEALSTEPVQVDWVTLNPRVKNRSSPDVSTNLISPTPAPLVEAQGWVINNLGEVSSHSPSAHRHTP